MNIIIYLIITEASLAHHPQKPVNQGKQVDKHTRINFFCDVVHNVLIASIKERFFFRVDFRSVCISTKGPFTLSKSEREREIFDVCHQYC